jgi:copper chaperone NosL
MNKIFILMLICLSLLSGCGDSPPPAQTQLPQAMTTGDECHVCGMLIKKFPGPKGEAFQRGESQAKKFCSTRDLFSYLLQPENKSNVQTVYVHDMARSPWNEPNDEHLIDAHHAWYVIGHKERGAMGATLASFGQRDAAEQFIVKSGGKLIRFDEITMDVINTLELGSHKH